MSWVSCQYPFVSCVFDGVGRVVTLGHRFFSQNRLSVQPLLWCLCIPCVQSHASTSTDTLKSKALAGIQLFGCKIIQRRLGLPWNSGAKYACPNGRELEAVTHIQFTSPLLPPIPPPPHGCAELKAITHNSSTPSPPSWNGCATSIKRKMQKLKTLEAVYQLFAVLLMMFCSCFRIRK